MSTHEASAAPRAHLSVRPRGPPQAREIASARYETDLGPRIDGGGFLSTVTDYVRESTRNDVGGYRRTACNGTVIAGREGRILAMTPMLLPLLALAFIQPPAGTLTTEERALTAFVDADNDRALALLEKAVNINSGTMNFAGVRAVGALLRPEFDALGFKTEWVDGASFERAGHLVADHPGPGRRILLIGHLDTVFEPNSPFQKFERTNPDAAKGPGITDMKGGEGPRAGNCG